MVIDVYFEYNQFVSNPIKSSFLENTYPTFALFLKEKEFIDKIIVSASEYSTAQLVHKTHSEEPWLSTNTDETICNQLLLNYFKDNNPLTIS